MRIISRPCWLLASILLALPLIGISAICAGEAKEEKKEYDPHITYTFPAGGQRGTTAEVMIRGRGLEGTSEASVSGEGVTAKVIAIEEPSTKLQQRSKDRQDTSDNPNVVRLEITIAEGAELGQRDLRLTTPKGVTNRFRFVVGQLPEVREVEPDAEADAAKNAPKNVAKNEEPQLLESLPVLVNGQIFQGDRDTFRFAAKAGQTIVCDVHGQKLLPFIADAVPGWLQASLTLYDSAGKEVAYNDDFRFHPDPMVIYKVEKDGEYTVEIKDVLFRGREDLVYRLAIGELPCVTHIFPLGGKRGSDVEVELHGVNLVTDAAKLTLTDDCPALRDVGTENGELSSNQLPFAVDDLAEMVEAEPNNQTDQANEIETPVVINGRIQEKGDIDSFVIHAKAKQRLVMEVRARRLESPLDSIITLIDPRGRQVLENDDTIDESEGLVTHHCDSRLEYTFPADGDYVLQIREVQGQGGDEYAYRLVVAPRRPDFTLRIVPDNPRVGQGESSVIKIKAFRRDGFAGPIDLAITDLPAGCTASPATIGLNQKETRFTVTAAADAPLGLCRPKIVGTAQVGEESIVREATPSEDLMQAFIYWHNVPSRDFSLAVAESKSYVLSIDTPPGEVLKIPQGGNVQVKVTAQRKDGQKGAIRLAVDTPPRGVTVKATPVAADKDEATITITTTKQASVGFRDNIIVNGSLRIGKNTITGVVPAIPIEVIEPQK